MQLAFFITEFFFGVINKLWYDMMIDILVSFLERSQFGIKIIWKQLGDGK